MKKIYLTVLCALFAVSVFGQNLKKLDEKYGFRDAVFETDFTSYQDMALLEDGGDNKYYKRTSDALKIGEAELTEISYGFYKGKLASILLKTNSLTDSRALLETLAAQYGKGWQANRYIQKYSWFAKKTTMSYDQNSATGAATVFIFSNPMTDLKKKEQAAAAKKATSDL